MKELSDKEQRELQRRIELRNELRNKLQKKPIPKPNYCRIDDCGYCIKNFGGEIGEE